jgi:hypothetical protein
LKKITLAEFKRLKADAIRKGPCVEITDDSKTVGILIIAPPAEYGMRERILAQGDLMDSGRDIKETYNADIRNS